MRFNWRWIIGGVVFAGALGIASLIMLVHLLPRGLMKGAGIDPLYVTSVERVKASGVVTTELGTPVEVGTVTGLNVSANLIDAHRAPETGKGVASFDYPVTGPKAKGIVHVSASEAKGVWDIQKIVVELPSSEITVEDKSVPET